MFAVSEEPIQSMLRVPYKSLLAYLKNRNPSAVLPEANTTTRNTSFYRRSPRERGPKPCYYNDELIKGFYAI